MNRAPFAERIADVLLGLPQGNSLTIGIHGPWGDGKTTVLNIIRAKLDSSADTVVVEFNPWRFTEESTMLAEFFRDLAAKIRAKRSWKWVADELHAVYGDSPRSVLFFVQLAMH